MGLIKWNAAYLFHFIFIRPHYPGEHDNEEKEEDQEGAKSVNAYAAYFLQIIYKFHVDWFID